MQGIFPSDRVTDNWVTNPAVLPADLRGDAGSIPQLADASNARMTAYKARADRAAAAGRGPAGLRRRRPGPSSCWSASGHTWRAELVRPRTPSAYLRAIMAEAPSSRTSCWPRPARRGGRTRWSSRRRPHPWPAPLDPEALRRRQEAAPAVVSGRGSGSPRPGSYEDPDAAAAAARRRGTGGRLGCRPGAAAGRGRRRPGRERTGRRLPASLSTTAVLRLASRPGRVRRRAGPADAAAAVPGGPVRHPVPPVGRALLRPGAGRPARWASSRWSTPTTCRDRADAGSDGRAGAARAVRGVRGRAVRRHRAVRDRGAVHRAGRRPAGPRPDRRGLRRRPPNRGDSGSGWSTGRRAGPRRPTRCSWRSTGWPGRRPADPAEQVDAVFYYVRTDRLVRPEPLPDRAEIGPLLDGDGSPESDEAD